MGGAVSRGGTLCPFCVPVHNIIKEREEKVVDSSFCQCDCALSTVRQYLVRTSYVFDLQYADDAAYSAPTPLSLQKSITAINDAYRAGGMMVNVK